MASSVHRRRWAHCIAFVAILTVFSFARFGHAWAPPIRVGRLRAPQRIADRRLYASGIVRGDGDTAMVQKAADKLGSLERARSENEVVHAVKALATALRSTGSRNSNSNSNSGDDGGGDSGLSFTDRARVPALVWALFRDGIVGGDTASAPARSPTLLADCLWAVGTVRQPLAPPSPPPPAAFATPWPTHTRNRSAHATHEEEEGWDVSQSPEYALAALCVHEMCVARSPLAGRVAAKAVVGLARLKLAWHYIDVEYVHVHAQPPRGGGGAQEQEQGPRGAAADDVRERQRPVFRPGSGGVIVTRRRRSSTTDQSPSSSSASGDLTRLLLGAADDLDGRALSNVLWSLGALHCDWHADLPRPLRAKVTYFSPRPLPLSPPPPPPFTTRSHPPP